MDPSLVVPTFRNPRTFPHTLSDLWGMGVTGTKYYLQDGMVRVKLQDSSQSTTGLSSVRQARDGLSDALNTPSLNTNIPPLPQSPRTIGTSYSLNDNGKLKTDMIDAQYPRRLPTLTQTSKLPVKFVTKLRRKRLRRPYQCGGKRQKGGITPADIVHTNRARAAMPGLRRPPVPRRGSTGVARTGSIFPGPPGPDKGTIRSMHTALRRRYGSSRVPAMRTQAPLSTVATNALTGLRNVLNIKPLLKKAAIAGGAGLATTGILGGVLGGLLSRRSKKGKR